MTCVTYRLANKIVVICTQLSHDLHHLQIMRPDISTLYLTTPHCSLPMNSSASLLPLMAPSHRNQANAPDAPGNPNTASGSGSQATQATDTTAPGTAPGMPMARAPFHQAKLEIPLLNDNDNSYTCWCKTVTLVLRY